VIIGSETIKEGVSLNGNTTTIYNTCLGWNPTETIQVEGRAWRQNNKQGHVHVVYPLMNDSVDSFMYQKHCEKAPRLGAIYSYKGDQLNGGDIDPEKLKFALIKDPEKRAKFKIGMEKEEVENKRGAMQVQAGILVENAKRLKQAESAAGSCGENISDYEKEPAEAKAEYHVKRLKNNIREAKTAGRANRTRLTPSAQRLAKRASIRKPVLSAKSGNCRTKSS
jgi:hypothetical protein